MNESEGDVSRRLIEASAWRVHLTEISADSTPEFELWLLSDIRNIEAWRRVEAPWDYLGDHAAEPEILSARSAALGLPHFGRRPRPPEVPWRAIAATVFIVLMGVAGATYWWLQPIDYQTSVGERRTLTLADGTRLSLDSDSEVRVSYSLRSRNLELLRGQARFEVAHDASRPFLVVAGGARVRATGTDFNIDLPSQDLVVTLLQGHVAVTESGRQITLQTGEELTIEPNEPPSIAPADPADVLAWQGGQVVFHNAPLSAVIARLNRYNKAQFVLGDPSLAKLRVSGTFNTGDALGVADILSRYLAIQAVYSDSGKIELRR